MMLVVVSPDPASVVAGWIPVVLIACLAIAVVLISRSMRKQMRKIRIPQEGVPTRRGPRSEATDRSEDPKER